VTLEPLLLARQLVAAAATAVSLLAASACGQAPGAGPNAEASWVAGRDSPIAVPTPKPTAATVTTSASATKKPTTRMPAVVSHGPRTGNRVALTFDADMTTEMLARLDNGQATSYANLNVIELLEQEGVPATFFLTGMWVKRYPDVTKRLADNPLFELANHTWSHRAYTAGCYHLAQVPRAEMASELWRTFDIIRPYGGNQTRYFRFPGLCFNAAALAAIAPVDVVVIQADVISGDPLATAWQPIVNAVLGKVKPGSIVVLHVTEDNARMTDEALPPILEGLRQKGLRPVRLSELLGG
jgi:hypothetical protein